MRLGGANCGHLRIRDSTLEEEDGRAVSVASCDIEGGHATYAGADIGASGKQVLHKCGSALVRSEHQGRVNRRPRSGPAAFEVGARREEDLNHLNVLCSLPATTRARHTHARVQKRLPRAPLDLCSGCEKEAGDFGAPVERGAVERSVAIAGAQQDIRAVAEEHLDNLDMAICALASISIVSL